jgi:hypothetical protein
MSGKCIESLTEPGKVRATRARQGKSRPGNSRRRREESGIWGTRTPPNHRIGARVVPTRSGLGMPWRLRIETIRAPGQITPKPDVGRDGALRRHRAVTGAERILANVRHGTIPSDRSARSGTAQRSVPTSLGLVQLRSSGTRTPPNHRIGARVVSTRSGLGMPWRLRIETIRAPGQIRALPNPLRY